MNLKSLINNLKEPFLKALFLCSKVKKLQFVNKTFTKTQFLLTKKLYKNVC